MPEAVPRNFLRSLARARGAVGALPEEPLNMRSRRQRAERRGGRGVVVVISVGGVDSAMVVVLDAASNE